MIRTSIDVQKKIRAFGIDSSLEQAGKTPKHYLNVYRTYLYFARCRCYGL
jgi:hypothetical protein